MLHQLLAFAALLCVTNALNQQLSGSSGAGRTLLAAANAARRRIGMSTLRWDAGLAKNANSHGSTIGCSLTHTSLAKRGQAASLSGTSFTVPTYSYSTFATKYYGENLAVSGGSTPAPSSAAAASANKGWIDDERSIYTLSSNKCSPTSKIRSCGHYTQTVWKETKYMGCSYHTCTGTTWNTAIVCQYWPAGNLASQAPNISHSGYGDAMVFNFDFKSNTTTLLLGATVLNTLLIIFMIVYKSRTRASAGYQKQLAQTDYDTEEEEAINQVV